jgi:hypothetical protein
MVEAYSHEVSSCGYWSGGDGEGLFYAYAYPEPEGFPDPAIKPPQACYDAGLGEFVLPYADVRTAPDPDARLREFVTSAHTAVESLAHWPVSR